MPDEKFFKIIEIAKRRGFFWQSYELYGGLAGLYDYAHYGALMKDNIIQILKEYYVTKLGFLMIDSPNIGAEEVYVASGHAEKFADYLVECPNCGVFRAEDLLGHSPKNEEEIRNLECPNCKNNIRAVGMFNLMFKMNYGPTMDKIAYLRPETAQGIFVNFDKLYRIAREKLPMGVVQVGKGFRNEISPRNALLRMREFNMFEVEVFLDEHRRWPLSDDVLSCEIRILAKNGSESSTSIKEALRNGVISSEAMAFFIYSTYKLMLELGIPKESIRFRQHREDELAHYASDCWDCEINFGDSWIEVVGIADRGSYDLERHSRYSKKDLRISKECSENSRKIVKIKRANMKVLGPIFKDKAKYVAEIIENSSEDIEEIMGVKLPPDAYSIEERVLDECEKFYPVVVEPSYGIDRILLAILYTSYYEREEGYRVLRLRPKVAPVKVGVFPLVCRDELDRIALEVQRLISNSGIVCYYDESGSIGRRYARADEVGVPFCITIDYETKENNTVTIRERDSTQQKRIEISRLTSVLRDLCEERISFWDL